MKNIFNKYSLAATALATFALCAEAQESRTSYFMETSSFRHQMNPALLDAPYKSVLLGNINVGTTGNVGLGNFIYKTEGNSKYDYTTFLNPAISSSAFLGDLEDNNRMDLYLNYNIFSCAFKAFGGMNLVELNMRSNTHLALPYEFFEFAKTAGEKENYQIKDLGVNTSNYAELAFGHARNINDKLRVGGKVKVLLGVAYADMNVDHMDITMNGDAWRINANTEVQAAIMNTPLEFEPAHKNAPDGRRRVKGLDDISFGLPGFGLALDLGATYKLTDDLTLSAGITDLGFIGWSKTQKASSKGDYTFDGFEKFRVNSSDKSTDRLGPQLEDLGDDLEEMFSVYHDGETSVSQMLAATINAGAEYTLPVYNKLSFGALYTGRINGLYSWHQGMISANYRPWKWLEVNANTAFSSTGTTFGGAVNMHLGVAKLYIGADRLFGDVSKEFIPIDDMNGQINVGITVPF